MASKSSSTKKVIDMKQRQGNDKPWQFIRPQGVLPIVNGVRSLSSLEPSDDQDDTDNISHDPRVFHMTGCQKAVDDKFYVTFQLCGNDRCDQYRLQEVEFVNVIAAFGGIDQSQDHCGQQNLYCQKCLPNSNSNVDFFECDGTDAECPKPYSQTLFNYYDSNEEEPYLFDLRCDGNGDLTLEGHAQYSAWTFYGWIESCDYKNEVGFELFFLATKKKTFSCSEELVERNKMPGCPGVCDLLENQAQWEQWEPATASPTATPTFTLAPTDTTELPQLEWTESDNQEASPLSFPSFLVGFAVATLLSVCVLGGVYVILVLWRREQRTAADNRRDYEMIPVVMEVKAVRII